MNGDSAKRQRMEDIPQPTPKFLATLRIQCADKMGVVAAVSQLLYGYGINILQSDQFTDSDTGRYFQRLRLDYAGIHVGPANMEPVMQKAISELAQAHNMDWTISYDTKRKRVALMVSKDSHCLYDLLIRHRGNELDCDVVMVISNHETLKPVAEMFQIPFVHLPIPPKTEGGKRMQEEQVEELIEKENIDLIVLARYMQILSPEYCAKYSSKTINIHHSFLPAFEGGKPYHRAHIRGVKIIGATAHYATADLDSGPIIEQDVTRISHVDSVADMIRKGRDLERIVLSRAVRWHLEDAVLVFGNKTVVLAT